MAEDEEVAAIPLVEERLSIAKQQIEAGRLRVHIAVEEREENVPVEIAHDEIEVERVAKNQPVTAIPSVRLEGNVTIIPVVEEVVVVEKQLMLVEEIHIRRKSMTSTQHVPVSLRSERATIDEGDGARNLDPVGENA